MAKGKSGNHNDLSSRGATKPISTDKGHAGGAPASKDTSMKIPGGSKKKSC